MKGGQIQEGSGAVNPSLVLPARFYTARPMDRRVFLISAVATPLALGGCGGRTITVICDPELAAPLDRALATRGRATYRLQGLAPRALLEAAEAGEGAVVVTREAKLADRLQRLSHVRLQNRWKIEIGGGLAHILATKGAGEGVAAHLGEWLAGEEAARLFSAR